jgi:hypothetical protein
MDFEFTPVDDVAKVPEQFRGIYKEVEAGKFDVDPTFKGVAEAVGGLNRALKAERLAAKNKPVVDLTPLAEFGTDPAAIKAAFDAKLEELNTAKGGDIAKQLEGQKAGLIAAHQKELEKREARATALQNQLYGLMVENAATSAVAELKGVPELLMPFIKQQVKVTEADGQFVVNVLDGSGEPRYGATGQLMTIKELVTEMKANEKYGRLFESEAGNGGGMPPGGGKKPPVQRTHELSANQKIAAGLKNAQRR